MYKKLSLVLVCLVFHGWAAAQQQLENAGFEMWEDAGTVREEPTDWSSIKTSDNNVTNSAAPLVWEQTTDAHSGNFAIKLVNISVFSVVATGTLTNGRVHADFNPDSGYVYTQQDDARWHTAFSARPDSLAGWYKYYPVNSDHGGIRAILHDEDGALPEHGTHENWMADANFSMPAETRDTWTRFSVPFTYFSDDTPEYILVVIKAGNGTDGVEGSYALIDDLQLIYNNAGGIQPEIHNTISFYYFNRKVHLLTQSPEVFREATFQLLDITGHTVFEKKGMAPVITLPADIPAGIYIGCILSRNGVISQKMYLE